MAPTIVLISGANRGLGRGLLERYLSRPDYVVIGTVRDPEHATSKELADLPKGSGSRLVVVKIEAGSESDAPKAVNILKNEGIDRLDLVIANAGVFFAIGKVSDVKIADIQGHIEPNVYGVVRLYQAVLPLLLKSQNPKWVTMGSSAGWIEVNQIPAPNAAYGPSKIAAHWLTKRMNAEEDQLTAFVLNPGWVQTENGTRGAKLFGVDLPPHTVKQSCDGMVKVIDEATKESHGGGLWNFEGPREAW